METPRTEVDQHDVKQFIATGSNINEYVSIPQFYTDRSVFITGGTGFMGKVLVEKLLRSCPGIKNIYLLVRPKRGHEVKARLNELLGAPLFDTLRRERPNDLNKVIPILGDITSDNLGISDNDQALLCKTVSIVFHSAATVKFDEKLKLSVAINMLGTKRLVELCHRMMSLDALIHVSTAYCNCDRAEVSEVIYAPPYNPNDIISLVNWLPENMLDDLTPSLIGKRPNTYTFTKALAEHMLLNEAGNLPVAIVRPSIVLSSLNEPLPGWLDNLNGPTGPVFFIGLGLVKVIPIDSPKFADLVPVDVAINLMITAAWRKGSKAKTETGKLTVYNCTSDSQNKITWGRFFSICARNIKKYHFENVLWYPFTIFMHKEPFYSISAFLLHTLPIFFFDLIFRLVKGEKPKMMTTLKRYDKAASKLVYFSTQQWTFDNHNMRELLDSLNDDDKALFNLDLKNFSWENYLRDYVIGLRKYLMKKKSENISNNKLKLKNKF